MIPHTDGAIFGAALTARRHAAGLLPEQGRADVRQRRWSASTPTSQVAGREDGTSIAFGYAAESYIDFGLPLMFLPVFGFGLFVGFCYALLPAR